MTGIIEGVEKIIKYYKGVINDPSETPKNKLAAEQSLYRLKHADFYEINEDMVDYIIDLKEELMGAAPNKDFRVSVDARLPSKECFLYLPITGNGYLLSWYDVGELPEIMKLKSDHPIVTVVSMRNYLAPVFIGGYVSSDEEKNNRLLISEVLEKFGEDSSSQVGHTVVAMSLLVSLINQPRFVVRSETGTRQLRRQMNRGHGIATNAWHKIQWNLTEPVVEKDKGERGGWHLPLHYTRGHWRRGQSHWDDIVIRRDGLPYKWIEGFWSGHPAYGFKKSYHAPNMGDPTDAPSK
jgi:hypothetical protein